MHLGRAVMPAMMRGRVDPDGGGRHDDEQEQQDPLRKFH
jgi:hypothetical protein